MSPSYTLEEAPDHSSKFAALLDLQKQCQGKLKSKPIGQNYLLSPTATEAADSLENIMNAGTLEGKNIKLVKKDFQERYVAVLTRVPKDITVAELIALHPSLTKAERLTTYDHVAKVPVPTASVKIWGQGQRPGVLDLGPLGPRTVRPFVPDPLRCYRCQLYGHTQTNCTRPYRCSICSHNHPTKDCLEKKKQQQPVTLHCPNCQGPHSAASLACPVRKANARKTAERYLAATQTPAATDPPPPPAPLNDQEEYPSLPNQQPVQHPAPQRRSAPILTTDILQTIISTIIQAILPLIPQPHQPDETAVAVQIKKITQSLQPLLSTTNYNDAVKVKPNPVKRPHSPANTDSLQGPPKKPHPPTD